MSQLVLTLTEASDHLEWSDYWRGSEFKSLCIARGTRVDRRAQILEGAVVGSLSIVGEEAQLAPVYASGPVNKLNLALH